MVKNIIKEKKKFAYIRVEVITTRNQYALIELPAMTDTDAYDMIDNGGNKKIKIKNFPIKDLIISSTAMERRE